MVLAPFVAYRAPKMPAEGYHQNHYVSSDGCESGKCYTAWYYCDRDEEWQHGGMNIHLGNPGWDELYFRFRMRFQDDWQWRPNTAIAGGRETPYSVFHKLFRVIYDVDIENTQLSPSSNEDYPFYAIIDYTGWGTGYEASYPRLKIIPREDRNNVTTDERWIAGTQWYSTFGAPDQDGWHWLEFHVKLNSDYTVSDGMVEVWYDGDFLGSLNDVLYRGLEENNNAKMTHMVIMDNQHNGWIGGPHEQWTKIENIVVSTDPIGTAYVVDSGELDMTAPAIPSGLAVS